MLTGLLVSSNSEYRLLICRFIPADEGGQLLEEPVSEPDWELT